MLSEKELKVKRFYRQFIFIFFVRINFSEQFEVNVEHKWQKKNESISIKTAFVIILSIKIYVYIYILIRLNGMTTQNFHKSMYEYIIDTVCIKYINCDCPNMDCDVHFYSDDWLL